MEEANTTNNQESRPQSPNNSFDEQAITASQTNENSILKQQIEALLFISGEPISQKELAKILNKPEEEISIAINELKNDCLNQKRGLVIVENDNSYQITTSPETSETIKNYLKDVLKDDLSPASLETLAIITYKGPISRIDIDNIRGVNSSFILRSLSIRGLIDRQIDPHRANAYIYKPSFDLLRKLGIENIEQLPEYERFKTL